MLVRTREPGGEWIVRSHIGWRDEQNILYKGVKTSSEPTRFKTLRESLKRTISVSGGLGRLPPPFVYSYKLHSIEAEPRRG